ncbi:MAG: hypothetical protein QM676_14105 [Novosphingobium sp.]
MRAVLVCAVVALQSAELNGSFALLTRTAAWIVAPAAMIALFGLGGFSLARSIDRNGARTALGRMAWRLVPAIAVIVVASALVVGAVITQQRPGLYFSDPETWLYLLNIAGIPQFSLPGLFVNNDVSGVVNANVWIIPLAYGLAATIFGASLRPARMTVLLLGAAALAAALGIALQSDLLAVPYARMLTRIWTGPALNVTVGFLAGAAAYHQRARIVIDRRLGALVLAAMLGFAAIGDPRLLQSAVAGPLVALAAVYVALVACSLALPLRHAAKPLEPLLWRILLLSYPVQQFWSEVGSGRQSAALNLAVSAPTVVLLAWVQWVLIERPLLLRLGGDVGAIGGILSLPDARKLKNRMARTVPGLLAATVIVACALVAVALAVFALQRDPAN